jgi:hypothetical protein
MFGETITLEHLFFLQLVQLLVTSFWLGSIRGRLR